MELVTYLLILLICLVLSAFFSGSETALLRVRRHELEHDAKAGGGPALPAIRELLESISRLLVTILLGNNVVNILGAAIASALAVHYLGTEWGIFFATVVMTIIIFVFCEVLPKAVAAKSSPTRCGGRRPPPLSHAPDPPPRPYSLRPFSRAIGEINCWRWRTVDGELRGGNSAPRTGSGAQRFERETTKYYHGSGASHRYDSIRHYDSTNRSGCVLDDDSAGGTA